MDPKTILSRAALEACKIYWEAEWDKANDKRQYANDMFKKLQEELLNED